MPPVEAVSFMARQGCAMEIPRRHSGKHLSTFQSQMRVGVPLVAQAP